MVNFSETHSELSHCSSIFRLAEEALKRTETEYFEIHAAEGSSDEDSLLSATGINEVYAMREQDSDFMAEFPSHNAENRMAEIKGLCECIYPTKLI